MVFFFYAYWHDARFRKQAGGPTKVYELASNLSRMGHRVYLFVPRLGYPEQQTSAEVVAVPFLDLPFLRFLSFQVISILMSLYLLLGKVHPDIIYVRIMWSFLPMLLAKALSVPVILEVNDSPHRGYAGISSKFKRRCVHLSDKISYRLSTRILPVTGKISDDLHEIDGVPRNSMTVVPSGSNTDLFRPLDRLFCCGRLGMDPSKKYVGFIGTFFHHQGLHVLIESAASIVEKQGDTYFLLVGDGPMRAALEQKVAETGLDESFIFTGYVPYQEVAWYCGVMDICVSPLLNEAMESSAVKLFDYLACGKPVVLSNINNTGAFVETSGAVVLVDPENSEALASAVLGLLEDGSGRAEMGKMGREFVASRYNRKMIAKRVEEIALAAGKKQGQGEV